MKLFVINRPGDQFSVPSHVPDWLLAGKFFCQFFWVYLLKICQMAEFYAKFSSLKNFVSIIVEEHNLSDHFCDN